MIFKIPVTNFVAYEIEQMLCKLYDTFNIKICESNPKTKQNAFARSIEMILKLSDAFIKMSKRILLDWRKYSNEMIT